MNMYKGIDLDYYGLGDYDIDDEESEKKREEMEKEEKMMESMLYLEYLDKINNKGNLNIFTDNKNKINNNINNSDINKNKIDKENDDLMDEE